MVSQVGTRSWFYSALEGQQCSFGFKAFLYLWTRWTHEDSTQITDHLGMSLEGQ